MQGKLDEAERFAIDVHLSKPVATNIRRVDDLREPIFGAINQRPEVLARMSAVEQEKAGLSDGISEMLLDSEWNQ